MNQSRACQIKGSRCLVMGLGAFGGGVGATRWLAEQGAGEILVTDLSSAEKLRDSLAKIAPHIRSGLVKTRFGSHDLDDFRNAQIVIANPAVAQPWSNPFLNAARASGAHITTELRLALSKIPSERVIAVTGSSGKSTTCALIHHALDGMNGNRAYFAGNIGGSLLENCPTIAMNEWLVLELSSFMLWWLGPGSGNPAWSARIGALTNLSDNHLDWHGDASHYSDSKSVIRGSTGIDQVFLTRFDIESPQQAQAWAKLTPGQWWRDAGLDPRIEQCLPMFEGSRLIGQHNQRNALLALHACMAALRIDNPSIDIPSTANEVIAKMNRFKGLPHRLSIVHEADGVRWINDSKATTPRATVFAVESFPNSSRIHLIAGGVSKGADLSPIVALTGRLGGLYCIGSASHQLTGDGGIPCETLENAVKTIRTKLKPGDVVLLSPGCASWDQFQNYEARGARFAQLATEIVPVR